MLGELAVPRTSQIVWIGERPSLRVYGAVRHYELIRRFNFLMLISLPRLRGVWRLEPLLAWLISRRPRPLFCTNPALIRYWRGPVIVDIDDPTFSTAEIALLNSPNVRVVVTTTDRLRSEFLRQGLARPIEVIPSGFSSRDLDENLTQRLARTYNPEGHPVVGYYSLTLELPQDRPTQGDISLLARAMDIVWSESAHVQLWLIGKPSKDVRRWAAGRPQVRLFGFIPRSELGSHVRNFSLGVYPRRLDHKGRFSIKLIEYFANGIPVVGTHVSETEIIRKANAGVLAETPGEFASAILEIIRDRPRRERFARNGLRFTIPYDWDRLAAEYEARVFSSYLNSADHS